MMNRKFKFLVFVLGVVLFSTFVMDFVFAQVRRVPSSQSSSAKKTTSSSTKRAAGTSKTSTAAKKTTSSSTKRAAGTSKTSTAVRKPTSSSTKRAAGTSKTSTAARKPTSSSRKRAATSTKRAATGSASSSIRTSRVRSSGGSSPTSQKVQLSQTATAQKADENKCRDAFVSCMDNQINDIIDKYTYLYDDEAVQAILDMGEPFRCIYYDRNNTALPTNMQVIATCRDVLNEATINSFNIIQTEINTMIQTQFPSYIQSATCDSGVATLTPKTSAPEGVCNTCSYKTLNEFLDANNVFNNKWKNYQSLCRDKQLVEVNKSLAEGGQPSLEYQKFVDDNCVARDVNDLYFSYNYYCDLRTTTLKNPMGLKTNYCALSSEEENTEGLTGEAKIRAEIANVFGTTSSSEYYKEALARLDAGELKMVNFTDSQLYKERIEGLGLESLQAFDISSLLNTSTKCPSSDYKYNAAVGACQLYDSTTRKYYDAGLSTAKFISSSNAKCPSGAVYDPVQKKCAQCDVDSEWNSVVRRCQLTSKKTTQGKAILVAAEEEAEKDARSIYTDLGIDRDSSLFSINVVPPLGSGMVFPSVLFRQAANYCFDGNKKMTFNLSGTQKQDALEFNTIKSVLDSCKADYRYDLERYYLSGFWPKEDVEPSAEGGYNLETDYEELDFNSAKKSCNTYEQTLISVRDNNYAKFDTQIKNYLEDALATIIKNKVKSLNAIAGAANSLQKDDYERTMNQIEAEAERAQSRLDAELQAQQQEQEFLEQKLSQEKEYLDSIAKLKETITKSHKNRMLNACGEVFSYQYNSWRSSGNNTSDLVNRLTSVSIKVGAKGDILTPVDTKSFSSRGFADADLSKYPEFACAEIDGWTETSAYKSLQKQLMSVLGSGGTLIGLGGGGKGTLSPGGYRVEISGGGGGKGEGITCGWNTCGGGRGASGYTNRAVFFVLNNTDYTYSVGAAGQSHGTRKECYGGNRMNTGGTGGTSTFKIDGIVNISAEGGAGGEGAKDTATSCSGGSAASGGGGGAGAESAGYVRLYKL